MRDCRVLCFFIALVLVFVHGVNGEDPYRFFTWKVTYGDIYPLGVKQQVPPLCSFLCFFCFCSSVSLLNWCLENTFLASCFASFFVMYLWFAWVNVSNFAGDLDKWAIPRASNRCCYKWKLGYQCVQLPKGAIPHVLVKCLNFLTGLALCSLGLGKCKKVKEKNKKCRSFWYYI